MGVADHGPSYYFGAVFAYLGETKLVPYPVATGRNGVVLSVFLIKHGLDLIYGMKIYFRIRHHFKDADDLVIETSRVS